MAYEERELKQSTCTHEQVLEDKFSKLLGVRRLTPGDVVCADCGMPLPAIWNRGKARWIEPSDDRR